MSDEAYIYAISGIIVFLGLVACIGLLARYRRRKRLNAKSGYANRVYIYPPIFRRKW
jgi:hypothetical protein